jgi:hypothetical protein
MSYNRLYNSVYERELSMDNNGMEISITRSRIQLSRRLRRSRVNGSNSRRNRSKMERVSVNLSNNFLETSKNSQFTRVISSNSRSICVTETRNRDLHDSKVDDGYRRGYLHLNEMYNLHDCIDFKPHIDMIVKDVIKNKTEWSSMSNINIHFDKHSEKFHNASKEKYMKDATKELIDFSLKPEDYIVSCGRNGSIIILNKNKKTRLFYTNKERYDKERKDKKRTVNAIISYHIDNRY